MEESSSLLRGRPLAAIVQIIYVTRRNVWRSKVSYRIDVPERARSLCDLDRYDYADAFASDQVITPSPRQWFDNYLGSRPWLVKAVPAVHAGILRMRLDGPAENYGWRVEHEAEGEAVLAAEGSLMSARIAAFSTREQAVFATFVRYNHPATRVIWSVVSIGHRSLAGAIVAQASRRASSVSPDAT